jgi:hypothetical protein
VKLSSQGVLSILRRDRLQAELHQTTEALRRAEAKGDEREAGRLEEEVRTLTTVIAKMAS